MKSLPLKKRLLLIAVLPAVFVALGVLWMVVDNGRWLVNEPASAAELRQQLESAQQRHSDNLARSAALELLPALSELEMDAAFATADRLMQQPEVVAIVIVEPAGQVIYQNRKEGGEPGVESQLPLIASSGALSGQSLGTLQLRIRDLGVQSELDALIQEQQQDRRIDRQRAALLILALALAGALTGLIFGSVLAARQRKDTDRLATDMKNLTQRDFESEVGTPANVELRPLSESVRDLRDRLKVIADPALHLNTMLDSINDAIIVTSPDGMIKRANLAACQMLGYGEEELKGLTIRQLVSPERRDQFPIEPATADVTDSEFCSRDGHRIPVSVSCSAVSGDDPQLQGNIYVARNISDRKRAEKRIRYLARYDALTRVPNRMQFQHLLQQAIARARRNKLGLAILYLDMDRFKEVNDTFGHAAGDRCLEVITERLRAALGEDAIVGRIAGDEFGIVLEGFANEKETQYRAADMARHVLDKISGSFHIQDAEIYMSASIGIACYPHDADNVIDMIRNADAAMYHSKQQGGNSCQLYMPEMNAAAVERLMLKSKLRRALERDELILHYQPKVDLRNGKIVGAEALLRWQLPGHGDIPPSQFIPLAEEGSLIGEIGEWVLRQVCDDYRQWQEKLPSPGRIAVNLSLKQLMQRGVLSRIRNIFRDAGLSPTCLELEITETTLMHDAKRTISILDELYAMGVHLSIDDFGTGYSSLSSLKEFPISTLKIDQSFVRNADVDPNDAAMVKTIIEMGRNLDLEVVAEGVETQEQLKLLRKFGCNYAQGHLFGQPMDDEKFLEIMVMQNDGTNRHQALFA